jgi:mono/diheme cytochrome c family protein
MPLGSPAEAFYNPGPVRQPFGGEVFVRRTSLLIAVAGVIVLGSTTSAQQAPPPVPAPAAPLTAGEKAGRTLFQSRCAMCHVGQEPASEMAKPVADRRPATMGPLLSKANTTNDAAVRQKITDGSVRMPGYKHAMTPQQIDQVIAYMKTIEQPMSRIFTARAGE